MTEAGTSALPPAVTHPRSGLPRWPVAIGLGVPLALIILAASPLGPNPLYVLIGIPALLLVWVVAGARALIAGVRSAMRKDWRQCALASALPIVLLAVALNPFGFVRACNYVGDVPHFVVAKPYYDRRIAALPADDRPRLSYSTGAAWCGLPADWSTTRPTKSRCHLVANPPIGWRPRAKAS